MTPPTTWTDDCRCGGIRVTSSDPQAVADITATWRRLHTGAGHAPATPAQARRVRSHHVRIMS